MILFSRKTASNNRQEYKKRFRISMYNYDAHKIRKKYNKGIDY